MCQKMINHVGMYRVSVKKQVNEPVKIARLMFGVGKKNKK